MWTIEEKMELIVKLPYFQGFDNIYLTPDTELSTVSQILHIFIVQLYLVHMKEKIIDMKKGSIFST